MGPYFVIRHCIGMYSVLRYLWVLWYCLYNWKSN